MSYTFTQTELGAGNIQLDVLWSVTAQRYILQSNLQFPQLLRTIFDVADSLAASVPDYRLLRLAPATSVALSNVAAGTNALGSASLTGASNAAVGVNALAANTTGSNNCAFGEGTLAANLTGNNLSAFGHNALALCTSSGNCAFGQGAGAAVTSGSGNILMGNNVGATLATGTNNIIIGRAANVDNAARSLCLVFGHNATTPAVDGSLVIGGVGAGNAMANLNVATAGGAAVGEYLNIYLNGVQRKIALLLP